MIYQYEDDKPFRIDLEAVDQKPPGNIEILETHYRTTKKAALRMAVKLTSEGYTSANKPKELTNLRVFVHRYSTNRIDNPDFIDQWWYEDGKCVYHISQ